MQSYALNIFISFICITLPFELISLVNNRM